MGRRQPARHGWSLLAWETLILLGLVVACAPPTASAPARPTVPRPTDTVRASGVSASPTALGTPTTAPPTPTAAVMSPTPATIATRPATAGCTLPYFPVQDGAWWQYRSKGQPPATWTIADLTTDGFTRQLAPPPGQSMPPALVALTAFRWSCSARGLVETGLPFWVRVWGLQGQSQAGVTFPPAREWQVGRRWEQVYAAQGKVTMNGKVVEELQGRIRVFSTIAGRATLQVPAGTFQTVLVNSRFRVHYTRVFLPAAPPGKQPKSLPPFVFLQRSSWYARGVGLVKEALHFENGPASPGVQSTITIHQPPLELVAYHVGARTVGTRAAVPNSTNNSSRSTAAPSTPTSTQGVPDLYVSTGVVLGQRYAWPSFPATIQIDNHDSITGLTWTRTGQSASATGTFNVDECTPSASGNASCLKRYPIQLSASQPEQCTVAVYDRQTGARHPEPADVYDTLQARILGGGRPPFVPSFPPACSAPPAIAFAIAVAPYPG